MPLTACPPRRIPVRRPRTVPWLLMLATSGAAQPALAQNAAPPEPSRERTGVSAAPQLETPPFAVPPLADNVRPAELGPPPPAAPLANETVTLRDVTVATEPSATSYALRRDAVASSDPDTGLKLTFAAGDRLDAAWVRRQFSNNGLINVPVGVDRLAALVELINRSFLQQGYVNSGVVFGEQDLPEAGGTLALRLVLGRVAQPVTVAWRGPRKGLSDAFVLQRMPSAAAAPVNSADIERDFRRLTEEPSIARVDASLRPGTAPGQGVLLLTVTPEPRADLYGSFANSRSPAVGGERVAIGGSLRNLLAPGDLITAEYGNTSGRDDVAGSYEVPFLSPDTFLLLRGSYNEAAVVDRPLRVLAIRARDWSAEGGLTQRLVNRPLMPSDDGGWIAARTVSVGARLAHRQTKTSLLDAPFSFSPGADNGRTEYTAVRLTGDWVERGTDRVFAASLTLTSGLDGTRSDVPGLPTPSQHFKVVLGQVSYAQRVTRDQLELRARLTGQWSDGILYSNEKLVAGGEFSVRGYRESLALADTGLIGALEVAQPISLTKNRRNARGDDFGAFNVVAFLDYAILHNRRDPQPSPRYLASIGGTVIWTPMSALQLKLTYAEALRNARLPGEKDLQDRGVQFRITFHPLALLRRR